MLAWQKHLGKVEAVEQEVPIPTCPENGFLVRTLAAGVCHVSAPIFFKSTVQRHIQHLSCLGVSQIPI
jgi:hypothetical protein